MPELSLPSDVAAYLEALQRGDIKRLLQSFESDASLRDARGMQHAKPGGALKEFFEKLLAGGAFGGSEYARCGMADDNRTCALEYTLVKACGREVPPQAGLAMFERGDSGLLRSIRVYDDVET